MASRRKSIVDPASSTRRLAAPRSSCAKNPTNAAEGYNTRSSNFRAAYSSPQPVADLQTSTIAAIQLQIQQLAEQVAEQFAQDREARITLNENLEEIRRHLYQQHDRAQQKLPPLLQQDQAQQQEQASAQQEQTEASNSLPDAIASLVQTAFKEFKRKHLVADRSSEFLRKLKAFKDTGSLPKNLQVEPPKVTINDPEANNLLSSSLESIQAETNRKFLDAYISSMEVASKNHASAIEDFVSSFSASLASTIDYIRNQPFVGTFSVPADSWHSSAKCLFESHCNDFLMEKTLKKSAKFFYPEIKF